LFSDIYINVRRPAHGTGANDRDDGPETIVGFTVHYTRMTRDR